MGWQMQVAESTKAFKRFCHRFSAVLSSHRYIIHQQILSTMLLLS